MFLLGKGKKTAVCFFFLIFSHNHLARCHGLCMYPVIITSGQGCFINWTLCMNTPGPWSHMHHTSHSTPSQWHACSIQCGMIHINLPCSKHTHTSYLWQEPQFYTHLPCYILDISAFIILLGLRSNVRHTRALSRQWYFILTATGRK